MLSELINSVHDILLTIILLVGQSACVCRKLDSRRKMDTRMHWDKKLFALIVSFMVEV